METVLNTGAATYAMQGKFFYLHGTDIYTQGRDDIPKKMFIRGEELKTDDYLHLLEMFFALKELNCTFVLMVSKQDLLITHKQIDGVQVFFLGTIDEKNVFTPAALLHRNDPIINTFCIENDIRLAKYYGQGGKIYIPDIIHSEEELHWVIENLGSFVHTVDGIPTTHSTEDEEELFEIFSDTQNNLQLFIRLFFIKPEQDQPTKLSEVRSQLEHYEKFTPVNKTVDFVKYIEWFQNFIQFFSKWKVCNGLVHGTNHVYFMIGDGEEERMEKPNNSLKAFIRCIRWRLKQNNREKELHKQIEEAIFHFFCFPKNMNNCCHLLKNHQKLEC